MNSAELVQAGRLEEGLSALQAEIRNRPEDGSLRIFLFQLNCIFGRWEKALTQLQVLAGLNPETTLMAQIFRPVIACELSRRDVFLGERMPLIFGEPDEWMGLMLQANLEVARGNLSAGAQLRARAFAAAPATSGKINGEPFTWMADADSRFGPMLEVMLEGKYFWMPVCRLRKVESPKPSDLRDLVWLPAQLTLSNGATVPGHLPVRYPKIEDATDSSLRLARRTDWREESEGTLLGSGQRILATDTNDFPILECRTIEFDAAMPAPSAV